MSTLRKTSSFAIKTSSFAIKTSSFAIKTSNGSSKSNNMKSSGKSMRSCNWPTTNCCNNVSAIAASGTSRTPTSYGWTLATPTKLPMRHWV